MINFGSEFKNKKIIITGHTGLKGSWLTAILISYGAVIGISDNTIKNSHLNYLKIKNKNKRFKRVDIRNEKKNQFYF